MHSFMPQAIFLVLLSYTFMSHSALVTSSTNEEPYFMAILKYSDKHLLDWVDDFYGGLIETRELFPQWL